MEEKAAAEARIRAEKQAQLEEQQRREKQRQKQMKILQGWGENMSPLRLGKVMATLESFIRVDGHIMQRHQFIKDKVKDGWLPYKREDETHCYKGKPRTEHRIEKDGIYYQITKTEYEFARYLIQNKEE